MIKKAGFSLILAAFLAAGVFVYSASAWIQEPTAEQKEIFSESIVPWMTQIWKDETQAAPGVHTLQEIKLVRVDDYAENPAQKVYLVNVFYHVKYLTDEQADVLLKAYFLMENDEIIAWRKDVVNLESTPPKQDLP